MRTTTLPKAIPRKKMITNRKLNVKESNTPTKTTKQKTKNGEYEVRPERVI